MSNLFHSGKLFRRIGLLLMCIALGWSGYNIYDDYRYLNENKEIYSLLRDDIDDTDAIDYKLFPDKEMPVKEIDGIPYVGTLEIPSLDITTGVIDTLTMPYLKISTCRYVGSVYKNDMVIAGHDYRNCFGKLSDLNIGDAVRFTDNDGNIFDYQVVEIEQLQPVQVEEMITNDDWDLTLFSCLYSGLSRIAVRCQLAERG